MRHKAPDSRLNAGACARRKSAALPEVLWAGRKRASVSRQRRHRQHVGGHRSQSTDLVPPLAMISIPLPAIIAKRKAAKRATVICASNIIIAVVKYWSRDLGLLQ
jgi:hypothetical protein